MKVPFRPRLHAVLALATTSCVVAFATFATGCGGAAQPANDQTTVTLSAPTGSASGAPSTGAPAPAPSH